MAALATLVTGLLTWEEAEEVVRHLGPVLLFLMSIPSWVRCVPGPGSSCWAHGRWRGVSRGRPSVLMTGVFVLAAVVRIVLGSMPR